ncbi:MAG: threonyl-tRNA synthetase editing domain-containing protein [Patescibacteria group bacterium]
MRALLLHVNKFQVKVVEESTRPQDIQPEKRHSDSEEMEQCLVVFFCIEEGDTEKQLKKLYEEILKTADEIQTKNLMIAPFVHLSKNIAEPNVAKYFYENLMQRFKQTAFNLKSSHFGYHKSLLLDIKGHPGSFRYREFY